MSERWSFKDAFLCVKIMSRKLSVINSLSVAKLWHDSKLWDWNKHFSCHLKRLFASILSLCIFPEKTPSLISFLFIVYKPQSLFNVWDIAFSREKTHMHTHRNLDIWPSRVILEGHKNWHMHTRILHPSFLMERCNMARKVILIVCPPVSQRKANPLNTGVHPTVDRLTHCIVGQSQSHAHTHTHPCILSLPLSLLPCQGSPCFQHWSSSAFHRESSVVNV